MIPAGGTDSCRAHMDRRAVTYSLGQLMYTPQNIRIAAPQPLDRPWAGWAYVGAEVRDQDTKTLGGTTFGIQRTYGLDIGVTGPPALTEQTQKFVHRILGAAQPQGWDNQIKTEPGLILKYKFEARQFRNDTLFDLTPYGGFMAGNIMTNVSLGATARLGAFECAFKGYGSTIKPSVEYETVSLSTDEKSNPAHSGSPRPCKSPNIGPFRELFVYAGGEARGVARNIFLDGNTFRDSASVDKKYFVYDSSWGLYARLGPAAGIFNNVFISVSFVRRSPEFSTPIGNAPFQRYGAIAIGAEY